MLPKIPAGRPTHGKRVGDKGSADLRRAHPPRLGGSRHAVGTSRWRCASRGF
eukprot:COSAG02_NODE_5477_length_4292_cov_13.353685_3_plen_52_part_00